MLTHIRELSDKYKQISVCLHDLGTLYYLVNLFKFNILYFISEVCWLGENIDHKSKITEQYNVYTCISYLLTGFIVRHTCKIRFPSSAAELAQEQSETNVTILDIPGDDLDVNIKRRIFHRLYRWGSEHSIRSVLPIQK